jgi:hypothetical protein
VEDTVRDVVAGRVVAAETVVDRPQPQDDVATILRRSDVRREVPHAPGQLAEIVEVPLVVEGLRVEPGREREEREYGDQMEATVGHGLSGFSPGSGARPEYRSPTAGATDARVDSMTRDGTVPITPVLRWERASA